MDCCLLLGVAQSPPPLNPKQRKPFQVRPVTDAEDAPLPILISACRHCREEIDALNAKASGVKITKEMDGVDDLSPLL